jgi:hypothetical protein
MKLLMLAFVFSMILDVSCSDSPRQTGQVRNEIETGGKIRKKPGGSYSDTLKVNFPSAVFYTPDSLQLEKIKAVTDTMVFESNQHDCFYLMRYSRNSLHKSRPGIKIVEAKNIRYVLFNANDGRNECIDLDSLNDPCGVLIFDGNKKARLVDMANIDSELGIYFSK